MRNALLSVSSIALLASCTDSPPQPTTPAAVTARAMLDLYDVTVSGPVVLGAWNASNYTIAYDINDLGAITGVSDPLLQNIVLWETGTATAPASTTPLFVDGSTGDGRAVNAGGQVAGEKGGHAALWTPNGGGYTYTDIGALPLFAGSLLSMARGINAAGQVVGMFVIAPGAVGKCFLWTPTVPNGTTGTAVEIPGLGGDICIAEDINASGQIAGGSRTSPGGVFHAFVHSGGATIALQPTADASYGYAINNAGQVAGEHTVSGSTTYAAVWAPTGSGWATATDLGAPALSGQAGVIGAAATDINDAGFAVGFTYDDANVTRAFFWQSGIFTELPDPGVSIVLAEALTNVLGNLVIVTGADVFDLPNNGRHGLRWALRLSPVSPVGCFDQLDRVVNALFDERALNAGERRSLLAKVEAAMRQADQGRATPARNLLNAIIAEANALRASGRLTGVQAQGLIDAAQCAIDALPRG
jgi:uncharacterized membrane protein